MIPARYELWIEDPEDLTNTIKYVLVTFVGPWQHTANWWKVIEALEGPVVWEMIGR